jgi:hypothetical protein
MWLIRGHPHRSTLHLREADQTLARDRGARNLHRQSHDPALEGAVQQGPLLEAVPQRQSGRRNLPVP